MSDESRRGVEPAGVGPIDASGPMVEPTRHEPDLAVNVNVDPRIGSEVAGYRIDSVLGRGGMSVVYLAEDVRLRRKVALKVLSPELSADERFRDRFVRESQIAAGLDH